MISVKAEFTLAFDSEKEAYAIYRGLKPETEIHASPSDRAGVKLHFMKNTLSLDIRAIDTASFRACVNTYSRWIGMTKSLTKV